MSAEYVIVGGGLMGSAAAWQICRAGHKVLLIEAQGEKYTHGSSFGVSRVTRSLGPTDDVFSLLQNVCVEESKALIDELNILDPSGNHSMTDLYTTSPVTYFYQKEQPELEGLLKNQKDPIETALTPFEANEKFEIDMPEDLVCLKEFKDYSGTLNPAKLIQKLHLAIKLQGSEVRYKQQFIGINSSSVEIRNANGEEYTISPKGIVIAMGAYAPTTLRPYLPHLVDRLKIQRLVLAFIKIKEEAYNGMTAVEKKKLAESFPVARMYEEVYYSMIDSYENGVPVIKVGGHMMRTDIDRIEDNWTNPLSNEQIEWNIEETLKYFRIARIPLKREDIYYERGYSCAYTLTENEVPIVDKVDLKIPTVVMTGMSGVGAKGTLAYGKVASSLLLKSMLTRELNPLVLPLSIKNHAD